MTPTQADLQDPALVAAVEFARAAAVTEAGADEVGAHVDVRVEDAASATHLFDAVKPGYPGWRWAVTVASASPGAEITVSEVVLVPGPDALVAPDWVPWQDRIKAGDLGVGDLMPTAPDDDRLVPAYLASDDEAVEETAMELGLGRTRVMARPARLEVAARWQHSEFGPRSDMARSAPAHCGTCGFYLPLAGSLRAAFGTCGNEISPADGHVVHTEYGCGAHSEAEVEQVSPVLVADLIYDDAQLDVAPLVEEPAAPAEPEPAAPAVEDAVDATVSTPVAEEPVAEEPVAVQSVAVQSVVEEPVAEQSVTEQSVVEEPVTEEPVAEQSVTEQSVTEQSVTEESVVEQSVTGESVAEQPAAGEPVAGEPVVVAAAEEPRPEESAVDDKPEWGAQAPWAAARPWGYVLPKQDQADPPGE